ncbi:hypothetical protein DVR12_23360 [Chitinophaga silvatica]|uniref:Membrane protein involved in the export of O-antigen and teichoic acid n=1 Tax=Chitinophaga silvatica TaxID=2282649 RepID=A0A3E1Y4B9_9BACT|nr:oligosaccharide flippase family protein [Chitinophaga silvatica]RFS19570.1 hypothetical protein DVR12_23360 [Chitinophaga silvatica]
MGFNISAILKNRHLHSLMGNVVMAFFNVLSFALLVRILLPVAFGEWVLFLATYNILDQIRTALLQSGIIRFCAGTDTDNYNQVTGAAWYVALLLTGTYIILSTILFAFSGNLFSPTWHFFLGSLGIMTLLSLPFNMTTWLLQANQRFDKIVQVRVMQNGSYLILLIVLYLLQQLNLHTVVYAYAISLLLTSIYCMFFRWTALHTLKHRNTAKMKEIFKYGQSIVGSMLSSALLNYSDNLVLRTMISPAAVAVYSIPQKFMEVIEIILRSFVATAQPTLSEEANRGNWKNVAKAFSKYTGTVTILILPFIIFLLLFINPLVKLLASSSYLSAQGIIIIFLVSAILYPIDRFIGVTLDMINKPNINFYKNLLRLCLNVILDISLVWMFADIKSVAIASSLNLIFAVVLGYFLLKRYLPDLHTSNIWQLGWQECKQLLNKAKGIGVRFKSNQS